MCVEQVLQQSSWLGKALGEAGNILDTTGVEGCLVDRLLGRVGRHDYGGIDMM
jgi:hypothetical protein